MCILCNGTNTGIRFSRLHGNKRIVLSYGFCIPSLEACLHALHSPLFPGGQQKIQFCFILEDPFNIWLHLCISKYWYTLK